MPLSDELKEELGSYLRCGITVFMGIGNILKGDDALGPEVIRRLSEAGHLAVDAGTVPESYIGHVKKLNPDTVIIVDAVHLDREAGAVELLSRDEILSGTGFTTHSLSPALVMEHLEQETGATILMLAIQPASTLFAAPITPPVLKAIGDVVESVNL